jgi:hypothetical protein
MNVLRVKRNTMVQPPMILLIGGSQGEDLLLNESFRDLGMNVEINRIHEVEEALRYLKVRSERRDYPPPYAIVIRTLMTGVAGCALLKYIKDSESLSTIPHFVLINNNLIRMTDCPQLVESCYINEPEKWAQYQWVAKIIINAINERWKTDFRPSEDH